MSSDDESKPLSEVWSARYDDRDDEELACHVWAQRLAQREQAMAQPIKAFEMPDESASGINLPEAANDSQPK